MICPFWLGQLALVLADGESCSVSWTERINEIVETRAKTVDAIPKDELAVVWDRCLTVDDVVDVATGLRLYLRERNVVVRTTGLGNSDFECLKVIPRPLEAIHNGVKFLQRWHRLKAYAATSADAS